MNYCKDCIRKMKKTPPSKCPEYGFKALYTELDGAFMLNYCTKCGFKIIGMSFFPQCELDSNLDDSIYTVSITVAEKSQYLKIAKAFGINVVQLKKTLDSGKTITKSNLSLYEAEDIIYKLDSLGVSYQVSPDLLKKYSELLFCDLR